MALINKPINFSLPKSLGGLSATMFYFVENLAGATILGPTDPGAGISERVISGFTDQTASYRFNIANFDDSIDCRVVVVETTNQLVFEIPISPAKVRDGSITLDSFAANIAIPANMQSIQGSSAAALSLKAQSLAVFQGTVSADSSPTTGTFSANTTSSPGLSTVQAFYATPPSVVVFVTGNQCKAAKVQSYTVTGGVGRFTLATPLPQAPAPGDTFLILGIAL